MTEPIIGYVSLYHLLSYFFIFGFFGWVTEVIYSTLKTGKFTNRGFLNGPICPIYGVGIAICVLFLNVFADKWWLLFLVGGLFATVLEFLTGLILEKIFKTKWWDYSSEPFNLKGYVCLRFAFIWGFAVLLVFKTVIPLADALISAVPCYWWGFSLLSFLLLLILTDFAVDIAQLKKLKVNLSEAKKVAELLRKDSDFIGGKISSATVVVSEKLKEATEKIRGSRLGKAFPKIGTKHSETLSEFEKAKEQGDKYPKH